MSSGASLKLELVNSSLRPSVMGTAVGESRAVRGVGLRHPRKVSRTIRNPLPKDALEKGRIRGEFRYKPQRGNL